MKPVQILLFLLSVTVLLLGLQLIVPERFELFGMPIKVFNWGKWLVEVPVNRSKIDGQKLIALQEQTDLIARMESGSNAGLNSLNPDSLGDSLNSKKIQSIEFHIDSTSGLQFPAGDSTILDPFFSNLDSLKSRKELIRILHFGDSQIEGDRITGYLRQRFQQLFGGCGPGLLPLAEEIQSRSGAEIQTSRQPTRFSLLGKSNLAPHHRYSVLHSVFRLKTDTSLPQRFIRQQFTYSLKKSAFGKASYFDQASLLFRNPSGPVELENDGKNFEVNSISAETSDSLKIVRFKAGSNQTNFSIRIGSDPSNDFYGVCLDCSSGVAVDNIPLRGSSGMELLKINPKFLADQIRKLKVKLVILEFGVNIVPYESPGYSWYISSIEKAISTMKKADPGIQFLIIGVSDMAHKLDGEWRSFENIAKVIAAQKELAKKTNSAYWELSDVMGGTNSILAWAGTEPPLAGKDYIHLTPKGAQVVGEFLFQAIIKQKNKAKKPLSVRNL